MPTYRFYKVTVGDHIEGPPFDLDFPDDQAALAHAAAIAGGYAIQVWEGVRLVGRIPLRSQP